MCRISSESLTVESQLESLSRGKIDEIQFLFTFVAE